MAFPLPGGSLEEGDSICFQDQQAALLCLQVISPTQCINMDGNFPDGVICVESLQGNLCSAGTPGNAGVVRQDIVGQQEEEDEWILGGVMANGGLNNCEVGIPLWITSAQYFIDWIQDIMDS